jgi:MFS family permease
MGVITLSLEKTKLVPVMFALFLSILVASLDNTIVSTAMGTIVGELGGMDQFVWVTSAYLIAEMAGMPIFGKLSDMYGRKRFFMLGIFLFLIGSILCGTAQNITQLSIYRAIQGIGGGALMPIAFTIIWDVFPAERYSWSCIWSFQYFWAACRGLYYRFLELAMDFLYQYSDRCYLLDTYLSVLP